jgi:hypothetical protein
MEEKKEKRGFKTQEEANVELRRIVETNYNTCKTVKPCRTYFDRTTNQWYLTSQKKTTIYKKK